MIVSREEEHFHKVNIEISTEKDLEILLDILANFQALTTQSGLSIFSRKLENCLRNCAYKGLTMETVEK